MGIYKELNLDEIYYIIDAINDRLNFIHQNGEQNKGKNFT